MPIAELRVSQEPLHVACTCGCILRLVHMNQRRFPRTPIELSGMLLDATTHTPLTPVAIIDLSLGGVRFATALSSLQVGDSYRIVFSLDDAVQTEIQEDIALRHLHTDQTFGAEFLHLECYDELDFYLNPWSVRL